MIDKKKLLFISAFTPFGKIETFVMQEACSVKELYKDFLIIPRNPPKEVFHEKAQGLIDDSIWLPLFNFPIAGNFLVAVFTTNVLGVMGDIIRYSRNLTMCLKNFIILPKAVYLTRLMKKHNIGHIHAHWASTTASMAYIIHRMTGIPFSFTLHRWDIYENNMLQEKVRTAAFTRCISKKGREDVLSIVGFEYKKKVHVVHMGVELPTTEVYDRHKEPFIFMTPANLIPVKGHRYLIEACLRLKAKEIDYKYLIIGDGPLEGQLRKMVQDQNLQDRVLFLGRLPHEQVIQMYRDRSVNAVVLPSIIINEKEGEGIPVALMEAMSFGVPVISTNTGGISELIGDGGGIMVQQMNDLVLADALERLIKDKEFCQQLGVQGRDKIKSEFDLFKIAEILINLTEIQK